MLLVTMLPAGCQQAPETFLPEHESIDLLIENGRVLDGLGSDAVAADVVVVDDRIVFVGDAEFSAADRKARVRRTIDAAGRVVAPGFIDLHAHGNPLETPAMENYLAMGVTTITLGQDGDSPDVQPLSGWMRQVAANGVGTNIAMFVGHGTLRDQAGIGMAAVPEDEDLERMLAMLDDTLDYTFGMSTGLEYNPGLHAGREELLALARIVGENDRMIMSHMRSEDDDRLEASIAELLEQGEYARVHISHLKSVFGAGSGRALEILGILDQARAAGVRITADLYPYSASYTGISLLFPVWAKTQTQFEVARSTRRAELRAYLRDRVERRNGPEATLLGTGPHQGKTLADLAREMEMPFEDVLMDVIGPQGAYAAYFVMNDELQSRLLQHPAVGICSDGNPTGFHPRGHGTFARIIETYVNDRQVLTLAEAVRKMTSFAATVLGLDGRGVLAPGRLADIVIFDPAGVHETATYSRPMTFAEGFDTVIVNGRVTREDGRLADTLHGRMLRPRQAGRSWAGKALESGQ